MHKKKLRIAIITNIIPPYRQGFYDKLLQNKGYEINIYCQKSVANSNLNSIHERYVENVNIIQYLSFLKGKIIWQKIPFLKILRFSDIIFVDGNPRHLSQAIYSTLLRILGKKVVIWSVGHSRMNNIITINIRLFWWRMFNYFLTYNENDIRYLKEKGFKYKVLVSVNNGLNQSEIERIKGNWNHAEVENWMKQRSLLGKRMILSSGRVFTDRYKMIINILPDLIKKYPTLIWCLIGDGPGLPEIQKMIYGMNLEKNVLIVGELHDENELAPYFLASDIFVYPNSIGLSLLHAFGYGLPAITHDKAEIQGPEYEAFTDGMTGLNYKYGDINDLKIAILNLLEDSDLLRSMRELVVKIPQNIYNTEIMNERFNLIISRINM